MEVLIAVLIALIGVMAAFVGAAVGGGVSLISTRMSNSAAEKRRNAEQEKWYAEHFLGRKIDALSDLYAALIDAKAAIKWHSVGHIAAYEEFLVNVSNVVDDYEIGLARAHVYLEEEDRKILATLRGWYRQASLAIWFAVPEKQFEIVEESYTAETMQIQSQELSEAYESALAVMEKLLSPDVLKGIMPED